MSENKGNTAQRPPDVFEYADHCRLPSVPRTYLKKRKLIEVSNGCLFCGTDKIHVSEIQSVNLLPDSGIEIITGRQTFESFHLANNNEISQAIFKQKELFPKEI